MFSVATATPPNVPRTLTRTSPPRRTVRPYSEDNFGEILFIPSVSNRSHRTLLVLRQGTPSAVSEPNFYDTIGDGPQWDRRLPQAAFCFHSATTVLALAACQSAVRPPPKRCRQNRLFCIFPPAENVGRVDREHVLDFPDKTIEFHYNPPLLRKRWQAQFSVSSNIPFVT